MAERCSIHYPDGSVEENVTIAGTLREVGDVIVRSAGSWAGKWVVTVRHTPTEHGGPWLFGVKRDEILRRE
jgi:hypothetical protein